MVMNPPTISSFGCTGGLPVSQAYALGRVCPNGTADVFNVISCSPESSFRLGPTSAFCVSSCAGDVCTQDDLFPISTNIDKNEGCIWPGDAPTPALAPVTSPPSSIPSPVVAPVPTPPEPAAGVCAEYLETCVLGSDCCSDRCVTRQCQKRIPDTKIKLADGRGGAGGATKEGGRRLPAGSIRGAGAD